MSSTQPLADLIAKTEIFSTLERPFHEAIAKETELREYATGDKVVRQGEEGDELFLIVSGTVNVLVEDYALWTEQVVLELGAGQSFGETALLTDEQRTATVQAKEKTVCGVLSRENFDKVLKKLPEVSIAVSRYLAQRLSVQCKLTGFRYVSTDELVFEPKIYRAFSESVLRRCQAVPLQLKGRTVLVALTRPNDLEAIRALQKEVPGLGIEPVACTHEDYQSFLHRHRSAERVSFQTEGEESLVVKRTDGSSIAGPFRAVITSLIEQEESYLLIDAQTNTVDLLISRGGHLEPLRPSLQGDEARGLIGQLDELLPASPEQAVSNVQALTVGGRECQLSLSRLRGRRKSRYCLELTDVQSAVPPLRSLFPSEATLNLVRGAANEPGRIIFLTGAKDSGLSTTLYSLLEHRSEASDPRNVLLFEDRPLIPQDQVLQFQLGRSLEPTLSVATAQRPELIAFDRLSPEQVEELIYHHDNEPTILATYRGEDLLDVLASAASRDGGRAPSLHRVGLILRQRLVRRICSECCEKYKPQQADLRRLEESKLTNDLSNYYHGRGCPECGNTGVKGQVPLFEAIHCSRSLLEALAGLRTSQDDKLEALRGSLAFSYRSFARLLISRGLIDPLEGLRIFPAQKAH